MKRVWLVGFCLFLLACSPELTPTQASTDGDAGMEAAFEQARATLDLFIEKIETPHPGRTLVAVKTRFFPPGELPQDLWVDQVSYVDGSFRGTMGDDLPSLRLSIGDKVTVQKEDVLDWAIVEDGKLVGGYTIRLALERMSPEEKERFLETLPYAIED